VQAADVEAGRLGFLGTVEDAIVRAALAVSLPIKELLAGN
jgi:hypothetical protein